MSTAPSQTSATEQKAAKPARAARASSHVPALDGIRGIAILLVLFLHLTIYRDPAMAHTAAEKGLGMLSRFGVMGVDLFFVLSGYLITGILFDAKGHHQYFRNFYARRTVRVFPLYYVMMVLVLIVLPHLPQWFQIYGAKDWGDWWYWLYVSNYVPFAGHDPGKHEILVVTWSLAIEEQFYLLWPLICFAVSRRGLLWISGVLVLAAPVLRSMLVAAGLPWEGVGAALPCRMDSLAVGAFAVLMARGPDGTRSLVGVSRWALPLGLLSVGALLVAQKKLLGWDGGFMQGKLYQSAGFTLVAITCGALITLSVAAARTSLWGRIIASPLLAMFGRYSYGLYLLHMPVILMITHKLYGPRNMLSLHGTTLPGQVILYAIGLPILLGAALLSWHGMEKHCLKLKDLFPMDKDASKKIPRSEAAITQTNTDEGPKIGVAP